MNLQTTRCQIRHFIEDDIDTFTQYRNNLDWMRHQGFKDQTREVYAQVLLEPGSLEDGVQLAIVRRDNGRLVGDIYLQREGEGYWVGYTIAPEHARQGYAFEAVSAMIDHLRAEGAAWIKGGVMPENEPSIRLLEKLGFSYTGVHDGERIYRLEVTSD